MHDEDMIVPTRQAISHQSGIPTRNRQISHAGFSTVCLPGKSALIDIQQEIQQWALLGIQA